MGSEMCIRDRALVAYDGYEPDARRIACSVELKYVGQNTALPLPVPSLPLDAASIADLAEGFAVAHDATFGYRSDDESVQFVSLKAVGQGTSTTPRIPDSITLKRDTLTPPATRKAYFGPDYGWFKTQVLPRAALSVTPHRGPLIIEEYDCTTVVRPGWTAQLDGWSNIVIELGV